MAEAAKRVSLEVVSGSVGVMTGSTKMAGSASSSEVRETNSVMERRQRLSRDSKESILVCRCLEGRLVRVEPCFLPEVRCDISLFLLLVEKTRERDVK